MKNVYDILLNFKKNPYEFYEWNIDDDIKHIKKIPSFKVDNNSLYEIMNYDVVFSSDFLEKIKDKTEVFYNRQVKRLEYSCIFFNEELALAIVTNEKGMVIGKSKLLFDESDDVIVSGCDLDNYKPNYNVIKKTSQDLKYTRKESKEIMILNKYLDNIYEKKEKDELKYMYLECFDKEEDDILKAYSKLKQHITNADFNIINKLKSLIKVLKK